MQAGGFARAAFRALLASALWEETTLWGNLKKLRKKSVGGRDEDTWRNGGQEEVGKYDLESFMILTGKRLVWVWKGKSGARAGRKKHEKSSNRKFVTKRSCSSRQELRINMSEAVAKSYIF